MRIGETTMDLGLHRAKNQLVPACCVGYWPECFTRGAKLRADSGRTCTTGNVAPGHRARRLEPIENVIAK